MRSRMLLGVCLIGVAAATGAAGTKPKSVSLTFSVPAVNTATIQVATIKAKAVKGQKIGAVSVRTTHDPHLQNESIVYIVEVPRKRAAKETIKVYALIQWGPGGRRAPSATSAQRPTVGVKVAVWDASNTLVQYETPGVNASCELLKDDDGLFESGSTTEIREEGDDQVRIDLVSALPKSEQGSPPEEVLDNLIANAWTKQGCPGQPEGDDSGPK